MTSPLLRCFLSSVVGFLCLLHGIAAQETTSVRLILHNGHIHTLENSQPTAQAVAIEGKHLVFVGSNREALLYKNDSSLVLDLEGQHVYPGFVDSHAHLVGQSRLLRDVNLVGSRSYEEVIERIARRAPQQPAGSWIEARGWDQNDWPITEFPHHSPLSLKVNDHPVVATRIDGHALLANAAAMQAAGITREVEDPPGGRILRDAEGEPTGVFVDTAMGLIRRAIPPPPEQVVRDSIELAIQDLHRRGITGMHDAGVGTQMIELFAKMDRAGDFLLRNYIMIRGDQQTLDHWLPKGPQDDLTGTGHLSVRSIKLSADGALGSRGAALLEDYSDEPGHKGLITTHPQYVQQVAERALQAGFQLCVHAIGDRANREVLDAFERALENYPRADHRLRVEHAQILHPQDIPRFAELGVIPSMQAQHQTSDMYWAERRLGSTRILGAYAWRSLLDTGVIIPGGSDFPVEAPEPLAAFRAAIARVDENSWPAGGWYPAERMHREEALAHMTLWPAQASFAEARLGSIRAGKLADLVVLNADLKQVEVRAIDAMKVLYTIFDGKIVYQSD